MYCNYPLTVTVRVLCYYMLQEPDGVALCYYMLQEPDRVAKLLSIQCNILQSGVSTSPFNSPWCSKKCTIFLFASIVMFRLLALNTLSISCFAFSICFGLALQTAKPSSQYKPNPSFSFSVII